MDELFKMITSEIGEHGCVCFPIKSIHGFGVSASLMKRLSYEKKIIYIFEIENDEWRMDNHWTYYYKLFDAINNDADIKIMLECCVRFIKHCKIDKITGRFIIDGEKSCYNGGLRDFSRIAELFEDIEHVELIINRCCVCHDWTKLKLRDCDHHVCLECLSKIVKKDCEECHGEERGDCCDKCLSLERVRSCPMCRGYITTGIANVD